MIVKKVAGKVIGGQMTNAEKKAMEIEIKKQIAEYDEKHRREINAVVLWALHRYFGFGKKRLKRFFDNFDNELDELLERYEAGDRERSWLCTHKLKEICHVDLEEWEKERK